MLRLLMNPQMNSQKKNYTQQKDELSVLVEDEDEDELRLVSLLDIWWLKFYSYFQLSALWDSPLTLVLTMIEYATVLYSIFK